MQRGQTNNQPTNKPMNAYTIVNEVALSRAFARYSLARPEVQRDPVLYKLVERKFERLDRVVKTLNNESTKLNAQLWNL